MPQLHTWQPLSMCHQNCGRVVLKLRRMASIAKKNIDSHVVALLTPVFYVYTHITTCASTKTKTLCIQLMLKHVLTAIQSLQLSFHPKNSVYYYRMCGRRSFTGICEGVNYTTGSGLYDQVCGRIIGYQVGCPGAFWFGLSINTYYVDGISVTHGFPRQHIWTFAAGVDETHVTDQGTYRCGI